MLQLLDSLYASVLFLILVLLGELLQFLPQGSGTLLTCCYGAGIFVLSCLLSYRRAETVELLDFMLALAIIGLQALLLGGRLNGDEWLYLSFATIASTVSFGCNRRFRNRIHFQNNEQTKPGNH